MNSVTYNTDCLAAMREMPDKAFDLAIVDPPYGIGIDAIQSVNASSGRVQNGGGWKVYHESSWDGAIPSVEYFQELQRVAKLQIIWGGNYFFQYLDNARCVITWDKIQRDNRSDFEMAWTNLDRPSKTFRYSRTDAYINDCDSKIHPTQKPVALYEWLLTNYAKQGDTILDTHLGSGSSRIAAYDLGFDFTGYELDSDYFNAQEERFARHIAQPQLFEIPRAEPIQEVMFAAA